MRLPDQMQIAPIMFRRIQFKIIFRIILFVSLLYISAQHVTAQTPPSLDDPRIEKAVSLFHQEKFEDAITICDSIIADTPGNPMGYFGAAVIYYGIMRNYWISDYESTYDSLINLGIQQAKLMLDRYPDNAESYFVYGAGLGFRGIYRMKQHKWLSAFKDGLSGYRNLKKAYTRDDQLYDAYYGLGLFYYLKSTRGKALTFLRLIKDEREKGIEFIRIAIEKGTFATLEGQLELIQIFYDEQKYDKALEECRVVEQQFSQHSGYLFILAKVLEKQEMWEEVIRRYQQVLDRIEHSRYPQSPELQAICYQGIANGYQELNDPARAKTACLKSLAFFNESDKSNIFVNSMIDMNHARKKAEAMWNSLSQYH